MQRDVLVFRVTGKFVSQHIEQIANGESNFFNPNSAGINLIDVQQGIQHAGHARQGLIESGHQFLCSLTLDDFRQ